MKKLNKEDQKLWNHVKQTVTPLGEPFEKFPLISESLSVSSISEKKKKEKKPYQHVLDLHGMTQAQAYEHLSKMLYVYKARKRSCILIITGKGGYKNKQDTGILKKKVPQWLEGPKFKNIVYSTSTASVRDGGEGALYVFLN